MYNFKITDWNNKNAIIQTELKYNDVKDMYSVFMIKCHRDNLIVCADKFVEFLLEQGISSSLFVLEDYILCCDEISDEIAEEVQNL